MTIFKTAFFATVATAAASCAAPDVEPVDSKAVESDAPQAVSSPEKSQPHGKTGAAVRFRHSLRAAVDPGDSGVVELVIEENYDDGRLDIEAIATQGLSLSSTSTSMSLSGATRHVWDVFFTAGNEDGVHYIDIMATVSNAGEIVASRAYSVPVKVGASARAAKSSIDVERDTDGTPVVVMEAEETIED